MIRVLTEYILRLSRKRGCLEAYCSALRLSRDLGIPVEKFFEDLNQNKEYQEILEDLLDHLAVGISMPTKTLERWNRDGAYLKKQFEDAGYDVELTYSDNKIDQNEGVKERKRIQKYDNLSIL